MHPKYYLVQIETAEEADALEKLLREYPPNPAHQAVYEALIETVRASLDGCERCSKAIPEIE